MNWENIRLVWLRELRDQLRDRRTLFVIVVLPLLMYPMLGLMLSKLTQFITDHESTVAMVGVNQLESVEGLPQLLEEGQIAMRLLPRNGRNAKLKIKVPQNNDLESIRSELDSDDCDVVVYFPPGFAARLEEMRESLQARETDADAQPRAPPKPTIYYNSTRDQSQVSYQRIQSVLHNWQSEIVRSNLKSGDVPIEITQPFELAGKDLSSPEQQKAAFWSKFLPLIMFIWALTGAFYPAVDICAGEKERGTLETLLTSPAPRRDIVMGKLLTVITFSVASALCNMATLALSAKAFGGTLKMVGLPTDLPSPLSVVWLLIGLLPMAAFFSAMSLALAALARSTKEGQYYLMPLLLVCMPLMVMPIMPSVELNLSTSMLPITGMVLWIRAAIESEWTLVLQYLFPVAFVTLTCCAIAVKWAVAQFNQEDVLFRDTENFDLKTWAVHAFRNRPQTPAFAAAVALVFAIFTAQFLAQSWMASYKDLFTADGIVRVFLISQLGCMLLPLVVTSLVTIRNVVATFSLAPHLRLLITIPLAIVLAVLLHPVGTALGELLARNIELPPGLEELQKAINKIPFSVQLVLLAVLPAICEELVFRGFILTGLRKRLPAGWAVLLSAVVFGLAHATAVHQTISATLLGVVLGWIAVKTEHISPCIAFHMSYNGLHLLRAYYSEQLRKLTDPPPGEWGFERVFLPVPETGAGYTPMIVVGAALAACLVFALIWQFGPRPPRAAGWEASEANRRHEDD